jgi:chorismate mutase
MSTRGVRGAIQVDADTPEAISRATKTLLFEIMEINPGLKPEDLASIFFTMTEDLHATYPALAARQLRGWEAVPLLCGREINVPGGLPRCLRVLLHWNTEISQREVRHAYVGAASRLRPDLAGERQLEAGANGRVPKGLQAPPATHSDRARRGA